MRVTSLLAGLRARRPLAFLDESHLRLTNVTRQLLQGCPPPVDDTISHCLWGNAGWDISVSPSHPWIKLLMLIKVGELRTVISWTVWLKGGMQIISRHATNDCFHYWFICPLLSQLIDWLFYLYDVRKLWENVCVRTNMSYMTKNDSRPSHLICWHQWIFDIFSWKIINLLSNELQLNFCRLTNQWID